MLEHLLRDRHALIPEMVAQVDHHRAALGAGLGHPVHAEVERPLVALPSAAGGVDNPLAIWDTFSVTPSPTFYSDAWHGCCCTGHLVRGRILCVSSK